MIDMLNIGDESPKEWKHDHKSHIGRNDSKVMCPPKKNPHIEVTLNINKCDDECAETLYPAHASGFEMVVKEDLYTDQIVTKAALPDVGVCIEDDPFSIVRDISIDEGLHFSNKSLAEKEEVGPIKSSIQNKITNNEHDDSKSVMAGSDGSDDSKDTIFDHSMNTILGSDVHNGCEAKVSYVSSIDSRSKLGLHEVVASNACGKVSSVSSISSEVNLDTKPLVADENRETTDDEISEEKVIDDPSVSINCAALRVIQDESNVHGHDAIAGNMQVHGYISVRSESSNFSSASSFAFPVYQSQWRNRSPVRMANADKRCKHRGWKMGLMCCRF